MAPGAPAPARERRVPGVCDEAAALVAARTRAVTYAALPSVHMRSEVASGEVLREVTPENVRAVCDLRVAPQQERFVTSAAVSLAEAYVHPQAWCRAVYSEAEGVVGFVMLHDTLDEPGYMLWRLLIDERYQRRGYGQAAVKQVVAYVRTRPAAAALKVGARRGEGSPRPFYDALGFMATGQVIDGRRRPCARPGPTVGAAPDCVDQATDLQ
jgi:diamine N-acetyltransferase